MKLLGIESSCDETAVAIVDDTKNILVHLVRTQLAEHALYGGIVPEIAARAHLDILPPLLKQALDEAGLSLHDLDGIAATAGPGLIGGLLVGLMMGKSLAMALNKPFIGVNHLEAHALSARLAEDLAFPYLLLLISGGHCQILLIKDFRDYQKLGSTRDDAAGEAFDKIAKLMGLGFPGGPMVEKLAAAGNADRFPLPRPMRGQDHCDFSFSGLKTAAAQTLYDAAPLDDQTKADLCAALQMAIRDSLQDRTAKAMAKYKTLLPDAPRRFVIAGGVAANQMIRQSMIDLCAENDFEFFAPPLSLCTDNAAMIAWTGYEYLSRGLHSPLDMGAEPRWPLDRIAETPYKRLS